MRSGLHGAPTKPAPSASPRLGLRIAGGMLAAVESTLGSRSAGIYLLGGAGFEKWKVALILECPEIAAEVVGVCTMIAAFTCMGS